MGDEQNNKQISRQQKYCICNEFFFWIFQVIVIALGIAIMAQCIIGYQITKSVLGSTNYEHSTETVWLWNQGYIIDIKVENTNNCPEGYQPLITYKWPGSVTGCSCSSVSNGYSFSYVLQGQCSSQLISLGCNVVNAKGSQTLNMWKGSSLLCYKRAKSMNFYNSVMTQAPSGGSSASMTSCATNQSYQVTTLPSVACPITGFSNSSLGSAQTTLTLDSVNGYKLNFISQTGYPIAGFKTSQYAFCDFYNTTNISPKKQGTYILEITNISNCPLTDPRMVIADQLDQLDFYTNNSRVYSLIQELPSYPQPSVDYQYLLGYIPYPTWTFQCRNSSTYDLRTATDKILFKNPKNSLIVTISIVIPCTLILVILFRLFFILRHVVELRSRSTYNALMLTEEEIVQQIPNLDIQKNYKKQFCIFVLELLLLIAIAVGIFYSIASLTSESIWIKSITKLNCTDSYLQGIFYYYESNIDRISSLLISAAFIWVFLFVLQICHFITRNCIGDLFSKAVEVVEEQPIPSVDQEQFMILQKQGKIQGYGNPQDSSELILQKEENNDLKIYDIDYLMGGDGGGETKSNFFGSLDREASISVSKKKKKKRPLNKKKKTVFKEDQP